MFNVGSVLGYLKLNTAQWDTAMGRSMGGISKLTRRFTRMGIVATGSLLLIEREFGRFDKAIRHATSVSETSFEQFEQMSEMALDASVKWNKAAAQTAQAFYFLGSAGLTVTEQMQAFNDTIMLSRAMGSELGQTVEGVVDIVRAFGLEFANIGTIADQLTKTVISSNQQFRTLAQALSYASSTARLTNNTLAETTAMLGVMANAGIKGSMAGTVLRRAMTNLMAPTGAMAGLIYDLGVNIYDTTGRMNPFIDIMGQISDQLQGATEEYKNMVFEVLFGRRAIAGQIQLFNFGSVALRKYANEIENAGGTTKRVAGKQMKAFLEVLGQLWQEMRRVAIVAGNTLAPAVERLANHIRGHVKVLREYITANSDAIAEALKWVAVISATVLIFPPLLFLVTGLTNQFIQLAAAMGKMALTGMAIGWKLAGPYTVILATIYMIRAMLKKEGLWDDMEKAFLSTWDRVIAGTKEKFKTLQWLWYKFSTRLSEMAKARQIGTPEAIEIALEPWSPERQIAELDRFSKAYNEFAGELPWAIEKTAAETGKVIIDHLSSVWETIGEQWKEDMGKLSVGMEDAFERLGTALPDGISAPLQAALDKLRSIIKTITDVKDIFMTEPSITVDVQAMEGAWKAGMNNMAASTEESVKESIKQISYLREWWNKATKAMFTAMKDAVTYRETFQTMLEGIQADWADAFDNLMRTGSSFADFIKGLWSGVLNNFKRMVAEIAAADLTYAIFGGGQKRPEGTATLMNAVRSFLDTAWRPAEVGELGTPPASNGSGVGDFKNIVGKVALPERLAKMAGGGEAVPVTINVENKGQPVNLTETGRHFDGRQWVINMVMDAVNTDPNFAQALRGET